MSSKNHLNFLKSLPQKEIKIYLTKLKYKQIQATIKKKCWIYPGTNRPTMNVKKRGTDRKIISLSVLTIFLKWTEKKASIDFEKDFHVSHLCGRPCCINPCHLSHEPRAINYRRINCHRSIGKNRHCKGHVDEDGTNYPKCIL